MSEPLSDPVSGQSEWALLSLLGRPMTLLMAKRVLWATALQWAPRYRDPALVPKPTGLTGSRSRPTTSRPPTPSATAPTSAQAPSNHGCGIVGGRLSWVSIICRAQNPRFAEHKILKLPKAEDPSRLSPTAGIQLNREVVELGAVIAQDPVDLVFGHVGGLLGEHFL